MTNLIWVTICKSLLGEIYLGYLGIESSPFKHCLCHYYDSNLNPLNSIFPKIVPFSEDTLISEKRYLTVTLTIACTDFSLQ